MLRAKVRELARDYRKANAPLTPERLAKGIGASFEIAPIPTDGMFDFDRGRILIAEGQSLKRQRFTLAHEVMHYLIRHDENLLSDMHEEYAGDEFEETLEALCNLGAAEMLLPSENVKATLAKKGLRAKLIPDLAETHQVSEEVAAIALTDQAAHVLAVIAGGRPLKVLFSSRSEFFPARPAKNAEVPKDHALALTLATGLPFQGEAPLPKHQRPFLLDAYAKGGRVYGIYRTKPN
ncbi:protein of unknown function DUF955 [Allomeiothermus silvanus DSM 9946]|uniref:IrrE N-terminal-like domain-containing protein n=1 Tax=Allomeiothermus silvanus (strain ATCC 700542 / DSM 9946 / NBRC 106475 / NCIMB 13440 / VI-R2) TaxID=526227 RepID=D7BDE9_ALLS1|nr:ImmA/IrrE family metallo-endopeptidase [Allomeiothermus silvanus]ADH64769.1 protein of unknown function DUF955 [Allomeiothermus silvanus DSM 9946]MBI5812536.1 ImmA/IrrE family metallo-endopeptidase [Allomeiothermus silvanus]